MPPLPFYCMPSLGQEAVAESLTNSLINCLKSSLNASQAVVYKNTTLGCNWQVILFITKDVVQHCLDDTHTAFFVSTAFTLIWLLILRSEAEYLVHILYIWPCHLTPNPQQYSISANGLNMFAGLPVLVVMAM